MAYYSSSYYMDDHGEYDGDYPLTHSYSSYDSAAVQDSMAYSSYKSNDYQIFAYDPIPLFVAYDPVSSYSRTAYSVSTSSEPKYIQYDPDLYFPAQTQFIISYSVSESGEPDFEEYDPTPYGGGYDLTQTYGKPLPPSDETCYPRSTHDLGTLPLNGVSSVPITSTIGEKEVEELAKTPPSESQPQPPAINETEQQQLGEYDHDHGNSQREPLDLYPGEESKEKYGDDHSPWSGYGNGYEYEKQVSVPEIPSGYGLEAMDLCEGLFGYWPCLTRYARRVNDCQQVADYGNCSNQWKESADYLFGNPYPYGERSDDARSYGNAVYSYERHYQQVEDSWSA
ncbi:hypothetical protein P3X46_020458 [Hevea brasiliensis]|uniref:Uncharacterized protein n=1 Tax=Hevea brasiliensis TaxID=3981 RepID=A0ABQ9LLY3_HEVBR|nr:uncharacterized protein LOC131170361 [Hevea brasiliensis]KAJ9168986.1 hypothetical protein P3X46_020458 [Hevea brasiliensis]